MLRSITDPPGRRASVPHTCRSGAGVFDLEGRPCCVGLFLTSRLPRSFVARLLMGGANSIHGSLIMLDRRQRDAPLLDPGGPSGAAQDPRRNRPHGEMATRTGGERHPNPGNGSRHDTNIRALKNIRKEHVVDKTRGGQSAAERDVHGECRFARRGREVTSTVFLNAKGRLTRGRQTLAGKGTTGLRGSLPFAAVPSNARRIRGTPVTKAANTTRSRSPVMEERAAENLREGGASNCRRKEPLTIPCA